MYFGLSEDQIFFQDNVKKFLEDNADLVVAVPDSNTNIVSATPTAGLLINIVTVVVFPGKNPSVGV